MQDSALVTQWNQKVTTARQQYRPAFERMRRCAFLARYGHMPEDSPGREHVNITGRHVAQKTAALYAKNPKVRWKRRRKLEFRLWDGRMDTLQAAVQAVALGDFQAAQLLAEVQEGKARVAMAEKVGRTLDALMAHNIDAQVPAFKSQMKRLVRRAITMGVAYVELDFQRVMEPHQNPLVRMDQVSEELATLEARAAKLGEGKVDQSSAEFEQIGAQLAAMQSQEQIIAHEGLVFGFPPSTTIIPSPSTQSLVGFVGTEWLAKERLLTVDQVRAYYGVDLDGKTRAYTVHGQDKTPADLMTAPAETYVRVREVWDRGSGTVCTVAEGYEGWLAAPAAPRVRLRRFFNTFALTFNDDEMDRSGFGDERRLHVLDESGSENDFFPLSDVWLMRHSQSSVNFKAYSRRLHVQAAQPRFAAPAGAMDPDDLKKLEQASPFSVTLMKGLPPDADIKKRLTLVPVPGVDPNLHDIGPDIQNIMLAVGTQEANIGPTSGATATETSIAESSRSSAIASNVDDLDTFLGELAESSAELLLNEATAEYVTKVVGPGAVWPSMNRQDIADQVTLEVEAGSSGLPNQAQRAAIFERMMPALQIVPGISPDWIGRTLVKVIDEAVDLDEAIASGVPSLMAMNAAAKGAMAPPPAAPGQEPGEQGPEGADKQPRPPGNAPGPQPAFPSPTMNVQHSA